MLMVGGLVNKTGGTYVTPEDAQDYIVIQYYTA